MTAFRRYAIEGRRLVRDDIDEQRVLSLAGGPSVRFYLIALPIGYLLPTVGVLLFLAIAVYLTIPARTLRRS